MLVLTTTIGVALIGGVPHSGANDDPFAAYNALTVACQGAVDASHVRLAGIANGEIDDADTEFVLEGLHSGCDGFAGLELWYGLPELPASPNMQTQENLLGYYDSRDQDPFPPCNGGDKPCIRWLYLHRCEPGQYLDPQDEAQVQVWQQLVASL